MQHKELAQLLDQALPLLKNPDTRAACTAYQEKITQGETLTPAELQTFVELLVAETNVYEGTVQWHESQVEHHSRAIENMTDTISQLNNIVLRAQLVVPMNRSFLNLRLQWTKLQLQWTQKILQQLLHKEGQLRQNIGGMPK